jgi:uncharacterized protein YndB with AHSA1/START domain
MPERDDDLIIERTAQLDVGADELWALISTAEGWRSWLVDDTVLDITPESTGSAVEDGRTRSVRIDTVTDRHRVGFSWWDRDDPSSGSCVDLAIVPLPDGRSQLRITERFVGASASAHASISTPMSAGLAWDVRLVSLWLLALHCTVMA